MSEPALPLIGDRVYFSGRKGPYRITGRTHLRGEIAVTLTNDWHHHLEFDRGNRKDPAPVIRTIAVADLIRDGKAWRERWQQTELPLGVEAQRDAS